MVFAFGSISQESSLSYHTNMIIYDQQAFLTVIPSRVTSFWLERWTDLIEQPLYPSVINIRSYGPRIKDYIVFGLCQRATKVLVNHSLVKLNVTGAYTECKIQTGIPVQGFLGMILVTLVGWSMDDNKCML